MNSQTALSWIIRFLLVVSVLCACKQLESVVQGKEQWDFRTYYHAAKAHSQGLNPYDINSLRGVSDGRKITLRFLYPPHCLEVFRPFTFFDYPVAYYLYLSIKVAALCALVAIWIKIVPVGKRELWALIITVLVGCRGAVLIDIRSGNVSTFEQLLLWSGLLLAFRNQGALGCVFIALSSVFKMITALLVPMTVIIERTRRSVGIGLVVLCALCAVYALLFSSDPHPWAEFIRAAGTLDERGKINPSSLALIRDLVDAGGLSPLLGYILYGALCFLLLAILAWAFIATGKSKDSYPMVYLMLLVFMLVAPRLKNYSLIMVLLPALHIISSMARFRWQAVVGCFLLWIPIFNYQPLMLLAFVFVLNLMWIWNHRELPEKRIDLTLNPLRLFGEPLAGRSQITPIPPAG